MGRHLMPVNYNGIDNGLAKLIIPRLDRVTNDERANLLAIQQWANNLLLVAQIVAGTGITVSPSDGQGPEVTLSFSGGVGNTVGLSYYDSLPMTFTGSGSAIDYTTTSVFGTCTPTFGPQIFSPDSGSTLEFDNSSTMYDTVFLLYTLNVAFEWSFTYDDQLVTEDFASSIVMGGHSTSIGLSDSRFWGLAGNTSYTDIHTMTRTFFGAGTAGAPTSISAPTTTSANTGSSVDPGVPIVSAAATVVLVGIS
jgi:hypothetical protein